jgi:hypothetical protein
VPSILLCWGYHRAGWIEPFERLKGRFRFTYLFFRSKGEEQLRLTDEPVIYWGDYADAYEILDAVRPDKAVFMSLMSGYPIALNLAAQQRAIPTYILQHGIFQSYAEYRASEVVSASQRNERRKAGERVFPAKSTSLGFLARTLRPHHLLVLPQMVLFFLLLKWKGHTFASRYARFRQRMPTGYICFTERNATIHRELDRASDEQIHVIGIPEYDKFFLSGSNAEVEEWKQPRYYLLIDQPLAENSWETALVSREEMIRFYRKLSIYCKSDGARLKVKLHPESYHCDWLPEDDNIEWVEDTDLVSLIRASKACFGMFSSLLLPAAAFKPLCLFEVAPSSLVNDLAQRGLAVVLDFFNFEPQDIRFVSTERTETIRSRYVEDYFFKSDGQSVERLESVLSR